MEVTVHPRTFLERLRLAGALTGKRYPSPILETVQCEVTEDRKAWLRATDGDAFIELTTPVLKVVQPGVVQIPRNPVIKALSGLKATCVTLKEEPAETVPITADPKTPSRRISVESPSGTVTLPTFDAAHFPSLVLEEAEPCVRLIAWRFIRLVERTAFAADEQSTRWALGGCALAFDEDSLHATATDGRAIAHAWDKASGTGLTAPTTTIVGGEERPLAPVVLLKPLKALATALSLAENTEVVLAFTESGKFQAKTQGLRFSARLPEGRFPSWKEVFPESHTKGCRIDDPLRLAKAVKDILRFTERGARSTELHVTGHQLRLVLQNDQASAQVELTARNLSEERLDASATIDPEYLLRFLEACRKPFDLWFPPEKGTPIVCRGEGHRYGFMPMERPEEKVSPEAKELPPSSPQEEPPAEEARTMSA